MVELRRTARTILTLTTMVELRRTARTILFLAFTLSMFPLVVHVIGMFSQYWFHGSVMVSGKRDYRDIHDVVQVPPAHIGSDGSNAIQGSFNNTGQLDNSDDETSNPIPHEIKLLINNPDVCRNSRDLKFIIYVYSAPERFENRAALRSTWANTDIFSPQIVERVFLLGVSDDSRIQIGVHKESDEYSDIIQGDFIDSHRNQTLKGLMGLKWIATHCKKAIFAIKSDDDTFVNIFGLIRFLENSNHQNNTLACTVWEENTMPILRDPATCAQWCVDKNDFPGRTHYPRYCSGLAYAISNSLVPVLYSASKVTPFFWLDDVYITGLLPAKVKNVEYVTLIHNVTGNAQEALDETNDPKKPFTRLFVQADKSYNYKLWKSLLSRLSSDDLALLSNIFIENTVILKQKAD